MDSNLYLEDFDPTSFRYEPTLPPLIQTCFHPYSRPTQIFSSASSSSSEHPKQNIHKRMIDYLQTIPLPTKTNPILDPPQFEKERSYRHMIQKERQRRKKERDTYTALHSMLPLGTKLGKNSILQAAGSHLRELQRVKEGLRKRNWELENNSMENPSRLEASVPDLMGELDALIRIRDEMVKRGDQQINTWLENVRNSEVYIGEIKKDLDERKSDLHLNDLSRRVKLKEKLIESIKVVKVLKERAVEMFLHGIAGDQLKRFSHDDLISFTSNFSEDIGSGGFGIVYKGRFPNDVQVAVKVLLQNRAIEEIFMIEVGTMLKASHPNLIKLYGFCFDCNMKALVYEFMEMGSLNVVLLQNPCPVEWQTLYGIALEIAMVLAYLHHNCGDRIIHHDIKPSNILLDSNLSPKVTDFGTARIMDSGVSHFTMTKVRGTCGYTAPEMIMHSSRVTYKCDVYSYGMLLFDILRIKSNTHTQVWRKFENGELDETIKECGIMERDIERARILYLVAFWCIQFSEDIRPSMKEVVTALEMKMKVAKPPNPFLSCAENFSMLQSEDSPSADESLVKTLEECDDEFQIQSVITNARTTDKDVTSSMIMKNDSLKWSTAESGSESELFEKFISDLPTLTNKLTQFSHEDIIGFTSNLSTNLGHGAFGNVYKGQFLNGVEVAVKVLIQNEFIEEMFMAEVSTLGMTHHRNIVKLYGLCSDDNMKALVYEYASNGSSDQVLYENRFDLKWEKLYDITVDIAKALMYLHDGCSNKIIHHDIKPASVLLDLNFSPKITNFDLAKLMNRNVSHFTWSRIRGTAGYAAPETMMPYSEVTYKCDVYSFGMMLFEILGRRRNVTRESWLAKQVWEKFEEGRLDEIIDECGITGENKEKARILSFIALWCIQYTPETRPSMITVSTMLEREVQVTTPPDPFRPSETIYSMQPSQHSS